MKLRIRIPVGFEDSYDPIIIPDLLMPKVQPKDITFDCIKLPQYQEETQYGSTTAKFIK